MFRLAYIALLAFLTLCGNGARAATVYHDLRISGSSFTETTNVSGTVIAPFSGRLIYTTGVLWQDQPTELLYSNLVIDGRVFDQLTVFNAASFLTVTQGDTSTPGVNGLYLMAMNDFSYMMFTLAGREGRWNVDDLVLEQTASMEPIAIPAPAVPEPQAYAMFLAGISLVTALATRRKIRAARR